MSAELNRDSELWNFELRPGELFDITTRPQGGYLATVTSAKGVAMCCNIPWAMCYLAKSRERIVELVSENIREMLDKLREAENEP